MEVGEYVTVTRTVYRKWWQFWKPRHWRETCEYKITAKTTDLIHLPNSFTHRLNV